MSVTLLVRASLARRSHRHRPGAAPCTHPCERSGPWLDRRKMDRCRRTPMTSPTSPD